MISFHEYLEQQRASWRDRTKLHTKHHNDVQALHTAFPGEALDKAKKHLHNGGDGEGSGRAAVSRFAQAEDKPKKGKPSKWEDLWAKVRADQEASS